MEAKASERAEQADPGDEMVFACPVCKSTNVLAQMWVRPNTNEILHDTNRYRWCDNCEANGDAGGQRRLIYIRRRETLEWEGS